MKTNSQPNRRIVVVGGAGAMGKITVTDLSKTADPSFQIIVADFHYEKAAALVDQLQDPRLSAAQVDVRDRGQARKIFERAFVIINTTHYQMNLDVMEAALDCRSHYIDLGGLFHVTRQQLELGAKFKAIGKTALIGMGAAPGITNILARFAANKLDRVTEIHCRVGSIDKTQYSFKPALPVAYSLKTILEEFSFEPQVFSDGTFTVVKPMSGDVPHRFPSPVGVCKPMYTIHSEVATLPISFHEKGVQEVSFKIAFDPDFLRKVRFLRDLGLASHDLIRIGDSAVRPIDIVDRVAMSQPTPRVLGKLRQYEIVRSIVKGFSGKKNVTWVVDCHTSGIPEWGIGLDIDTGSPPSIAAQMLASGKITETGVVPAEIAVEPLEFFKHLKTRKMIVRSQVRNGWGFKT